MTAIQVRTSRLAVKVETTEGQLEPVTLGSDFVALQQDAAMEPAFDTLTNEELKASLGQSEPIQGAENPTFSTSHYLRHSGVEGTSPNYRQLLITAFGQEDDAGIEHDTVVGSTVSAVNVDVGEGATYIRGQGILVKHGTSPWEIRCVDSVAADVLTPSFDLAVAPATGVDLGEAITYSVVNSGHQSVSLHHYLGNGGAIQAMSGARVSELSISFPVAELINQAYSFEGLEYFFNPIEITATDTFLDFTDDGGTFAAQIAAKTYKDPHELAAALTTSMNTVQSAETHLVEYNDTDGKFTVSTSTSAVLSLLWNTGANAANTVGDKLGYTTAADDTGATSYEADNAQDYSDQVGATFDADSAPLAAKNNELFLGDASDNSCVSANNVDFTMTLPIRKTEDICAPSGRSGSIVNGREIEINITGTLNQYDAQKFKRFRQNQTTRFQYNFGTRSGGNWIPGKCGALYCPQTKISDFTVEDNDGLWDFNITLTAFVGSGNSLSDEEVYMTMV